MTQSFTGGIGGAIVTHDPVLGDVIAYLEQRRDNCAALASRGDFEAAEHAGAMRRQCDIIIGDLLAGMHEGAAGVRARLQAKGESE